VAGGPLEHRADARGADPRQLSLAHPGDLLVAEEDPAGTGSLDAAEQRQQRRLAGAARAEERDALTLLDGQVDALQRHDVVPLEGLVEVHQTLAAHGQAADRLRPLSGDLLHARSSPGWVPGRDRSVTRPGSQTAGSGSGKPWVVLVTTSIPV
jgi:hypothetical protein